MKELCLGPVIRSTVFLSHYPASIGGSDQATRRFGTKATSAEEALPDDQSFSNSARIRPHIS